MATFKIVPVLALFMGLSTFAFAGAPKDGANTNAKITAKTAVKATPTNSSEKTKLDEKHYLKTESGYVEITDYNSSNCVTDPTSDFCDYSTTDQDAPPTIDLGDEGTYGLMGENPNASYQP